MAHFLFFFVGQTSFLCVSNMSIFLTFRPMCCFSFFLSLFIFFLVLVHKTDNNKDKRDTKGGSVCENVANRGGGEG